MNFWCTENWSLVMYMFPVPLQRSAFFCEHLFFFWRNTCFMNTCCVRWKCVLRLLPGSASLTWVSFRNIFISLCVVALSYWATLCYDLLLFCNSDRMRYENTSPCTRVGRQVVNIPSFMVRLDSQKHIDFSLTSPLGGGRPGRVKRKNQKAAAKKAAGGDGDEEDEEWNSVLKSRYQTCIILSFAFFISVEILLPDYHSEFFNQSGVFIVWFRIHMNSNG